MSKFKPVSSQVTLSALEEETSKFWKEDKTFEKSIEQRDANNLYRFVDGPPFVSGLPHYGHLVVSIAKDMMPRYQTMIGKRVRRVFGWDCHGLPIEEKVSKLLGVRSNVELEQRIGIEKYVQECRTYVQNTISEWRWYIEKIGRWVDMDNAYYTMDTDFMESVIWGFKKIYEKGLIYEGKRVSLYSTDTSTPVSGFEVAMDPDNYQDVEDLAIFVKFEIDQTPEFLKVKEIDGKPIYLLAWTTTPWTIPSNFALAVNKSFKYVLVEYDAEYFVISKDRINYTFNVDKNEVGKVGEKEVIVLKEFNGEELEGISYKPVYDLYVDQKTENDYKVYLSDDVTIDEGTGVLHIAPAFGEVDYQLGLKNKISAIADIDIEGKMTVGPWKGVYLRDASPLITEDLVAKGNLLRSENYTHRLPFYRGKNPLIYMAQHAFFIDIQSIKQRMLELNKKINWIPDYLKYGRFAQTLETSPDWCVSRNRYWATIMPIWKSEDGDEIVVGSIEEMLQYTDQITKKEENGTVKYFFEDKPMDLHRDACDKIVFIKDGKTYKRIPEVLDVWMDSGSVPFAEYHYPFENQSVFEKSPQADFVIEYMGQIRAWFNILLRVSTIIFDDTPFLTSLCYGTLAGTDGRKMSKSYGNYPDPRMVLEKYGADSLRVYFMGSSMMKGEDMSFNEDGVSDSYKFLLIFWNTYKFFVDYATLNDWEPKSLPDKKTNVLDRWILAKLSKLTIELREAFNSYDTVKVTGSIKGFIIDDFSTWYVRRSRDRVAPDHKEKDRNDTMETLYYVLTTISKLSAPLIPFITEEIYRNLTGEESVHLADYPKTDESPIDEELIKDMDIIRRLVEIGHAQRKEVNIKLRQPLQKFTYYLEGKLSSELEKILADELNVKEIEYKKLASGNIRGEMDTKITPELQAEGEVRELIRQVQSLRKEKGLTLKDKVKILTPEVPKTEKFVQMVLKQTNAVEVNKGPGISIEVIND